MFFACGSFALFIASSRLIFSAILGATAVSWMVSHSGAITKKVRNSARPIRVWLVGFCCVPSACRSSASTMMLRVMAVGGGGAAGGGGGGGGSGGGGGRGG